MNDVQGHLELAADLPALLGVACEAFEALLVVIRRNDGADNAYFLPMVAAGAAAASGRDFLYAAPALPFRSSGSTRRIRPPELASGQAAATWLAEVSEMLAARLSAAGASASSAADRQACWHAARCAGEIQALMRGGGP